MTTTVCCSLPIPVLAAGRGRRCIALARLAPRAATVVGGAATAALVAGRRGRAGRDRSCATGRPRTRPAGCCAPTRCRALHADRHRRGRDCWPAGPAPPTCAPSSPPGGATRAALGTASWSSCSWPRWPGGAGRQPRRAVGRHRGHHDRHRVPGRPSPQPRRGGGRLEVRGDLLGRRSRIAFLGTVLLYYAARHAGLGATGAGLGRLDRATPATWTRA